MTARHIGARLGVAAFAARARIKTVTLQAYISRGEPKASPVPVPCGTEQVSGQRWWCTKHIDAWINSRPRANLKNKTSDTPKDKT